MTPPPSNPGTQPPTTEPPATQPPTTQPHPSGYTIRYEVYTNCPASVTLSTPNGGTEQYTIDPEWPWIYEIRARARDFLYISAQVRCRGGTVVTRISRWDGRAVYGDEPDWYGWRQNRSEGDFVIATTSGTF